MKIQELICICLFFFLAACNSTDEKKVRIETSPIKDLKIENHVIPESDILNLKSYYLSTYYHDSIDWLYGYNSKLHALDCFNLKNGEATQISFKTEGTSSVIRPITGLFICSQDSIWVVDATQNAILLNRNGEVLKKIELPLGLSSGQSVMVERNYAISTTDLYYDRSRCSLLFGIRNADTNPVSFEVREIFLSDSVPQIIYPLHLSVDVPEVGNGEYANMDRPNITFTPDKIIYNYPVESHVYVMDRASGKTRVFEANSNFTRNHVAACDWKTYADCERHRVENPHFYELRYLPDKDMYIRLHVDGQEFDATKDLGEMLARKKLYLTVFDNRFSVVGESELPSRRYDLFTGWITTSDALLLFVNNPLLEEEKGEYLEYDRIEW